MDVTFGMNGRRSLSLVVLCCVSAGVSSADVFKPSQSDQLRLGLEAAAQLRKQEKVLPDSDPRVKVLRAVGMRLLSTFHDRSPWQWSFDVIESRDVNAFSLPGGPTFFYTGLLDKLKTEDELAAVLGHEMTHVRREHWARAYGDQQARTLGLTVVLGAVRATDLAYNMTSLVNSLYTLKFSRHDESQADDGGFDLMVQAGYNPAGLADVFQMLEDSKKGGSDPEFFSDHPSDKNRVARIQQRIKSANRSYPAQLPLGLDVYDRYYPAFYEGVRPPTAGDSVKG